MTRQHAEVPTFARDLDLVHVLVHEGALGGDEFEPQVRRNRHYF
jgi:hypothetical protein